MTGQAFPGAWREAGGRDGAERDCGGHAGFSAEDGEGRPARGGRWHALRKPNRIPTGAGDGPAGDVPRGADSGAASRGLHTTGTGHCPQARAGAAPSVRVNG